MQERPLSDPYARPLAGMSVTATGLAATWLLAVLMQASASAAEVPENKACLRCHQMATLAYRDPASGKILDLSIDPKALARSDHAELACTDCHHADSKRYPHPASVSRQSLECVACHEEKDDAAERQYRFKTIEEEFGRSIHATSDDPKADGFSCHSCHDPHRFRASAVGQDIASIVREDNQLCLSCHEEVRDPVRDPHTWLPKREKHRESVRCLDCHTPLSENGGPVSHQILAGEDSNRDCVNCHSRDSGLLSRLYQYRSEQDLAGQGWLSKAVFNQAYVVGMSRSPLIDRLALLIIGIAVLGLGAHGYGRYLAYRRFRADRPEKGGSEQGRTEEGRT